MSYIHRLLTVDFEALRKYRSNLLQNAMKANNIDAYLTLWPGNVRYMMDYHMLPEHGLEMAYGSIIFQDGESYLFPLSGDYTWIMERVDWIPKDQIIPLKRGLGNERADPEAQTQFCEETLKPLLTKKSAASGRLAVDMLSFVLHSLIKKTLPELEIVYHAPLLLARTVKCEEEIEIIRQATSIVNTSGHIAIDNIEPGVRECDIAGKVGGYFYSQNVDFITWSPQILSGPNVAPYFRITSDRVMEEGDPWYFDLGAQYVGYCSTISLFGCVGKANEKQREVYKSLYDSTQAALKVMKAGVTDSKVYDAADKVLREYGYEKYAPKVPGITFSPGVLPSPPSLGWGGCGIGTLPHEPPTISALSAKKPTRIECNSVFRLHPNLFIPGIGGGRLKNMVVVRDSGPEVLTKTFEFGAKIFDYP